MPGRPVPVAVVVDSTAYLPRSRGAPADQAPAGGSVARSAAGAADQVPAAPAGPDDPAARLIVVPLTVVIDGVELLDGVEATPADTGRAAPPRKAPVTTSQPPPGRFTDAYRAAFAAGAPGVLSVHLSGKLSGTCDTARLAAAGWGGRVSVVDSGLTGMGLGFVALAAAEAAAAGADLDGTRAAALAAIGRISVLFYVDSLEPLRRGGRISATRALLGTALAVHPILHMVDGEIAVREKVRTRARAVARLIELAVAEAADARVDVVVHHLDAPDRAEAVAQALAGRLGDEMASCAVTEVGAVVGAHVGPGLISVVIHRRA